MIMVNELRKSFFTEEKVRPEIEDVRRMADRVETFMSTKNSSQDIPLPPSKSLTTSLGKSKSKLNNDDTVKVDDDCTVYDIAHRWEYDIQMYVYICMFFVLSGPTMYCTYRP